VSAGLSGFTPLFLETCGVSVAKVLPNFQKIRKTGSPLEPCSSKVCKQQEGWKPWKHKTFALSNFG